MSTKKIKISIEEIKKIPIKLLFNMIQRAKKYLKHNNIMQNICKEYNVNINEIDYIPVMFDDLDVSAKTDHGIVILNYKLLCDGDFFKDYSYLIHEFTHVFQQTTGNKPTQSADDGDYLSNRFEQEGFANQVEYIANEFGDNEAEGYVDDLLDHHDKNGKERKNLENILLENI